MGPTLLSTPLLWVPSTKMRTSKPFSGFTLTSLLLMYWENSCKPYTSRPNTISSTLSLASWTSITWFNWQLWFWPTFGDSITPVRSAQEIIYLTRKHSLPTKRFITLSAEVTSSGFSWSSIGLLSALSVAAALYAPLLFWVVLKSHDNESSLFYLSIYHSFKAN